MNVRALAKAQASGRCSVAPDNNRDDTRMLLENDDMGFSLHRTTLDAGAAVGVHYKNHLESVYGVHGPAVEEIDA